MNKGKGAGGSKTNFNGKNFENLTLYKPLNFETLHNKKNYYLKKNNILIFHQNNFNFFLKQNYNIKSIRIPDECFIIQKNNKLIFKILEKKNQNREGSVETKLWASPSLKREYEIYLKNYFDEKNIIIKIEYGLLLSDFLKKKLESNQIKYEILKKIFEENNIKIFYFDEDYFNNLENWINN